MSVRSGDPVSARSVSWWEVNQFVARLTEQVPDWPLAGTPPWCALDDTDPRKLAAVLDAGQQNALRWETTQDAAAEASKAIAAAVDWRAVAQELSQRNSFYAARPWLKRQAANHA